MLACKIHFIFYFYLPLKTRNFNYSNLLLINISVGKSHFNHQLQPHQWYLLKLTNYIKAKCLYEVIFFMYNIGYLHHNMHPPPPPLISAGGLSLLPNFQKGEKFDRISGFRGGWWEREMWPFSGRVAIVT